MNRVFFNRLDAQVRNRLTKEQSLVINIIEDFYLYHFKINNILKTLILLLNLLIKTTVNILMLLTSLQKWSRLLNITLSLII